MPDIEHVLPTPAGVQHMVHARVARYGATSVKSNRHRAEVRDLEYFPNEAR